MIRSFSKLFTPPLLIARPYARTSSSSLSILKRKFKLSYQNTLINSYPTTVIAAPVNTQTALLSASSIDSATSAVAAISASISTLTESIKQTEEKIKRVEAKIGTLNGMIAFKSSNETYEFNERFFAAFDDELINFGGKKEQLQRFYDAMSVEEIKKKEAALMNEKAALMNEKGLLLKKEGDLTGGSYKYPYGKRNPVNVFQEYFDEYLSKKDINFSNLKLDEYIVNKGNHHFDVFSKNKVAYEPLTRSPFFQLHFDDAEADDEIVRSLSKQTALGNTIIFAPTGAGKTRLLHKFMSKNFAFLFIPRLTPNLREANSGSMDMYQVMEKIDSDFSKYGEFISTNNDDEQNEQNRRVHTIFFLNCLFLSRCLVFRYIIGKYPDLTPKQWLLIQLFPTVFLGIDAFSEMTIKLIENCSPAAVRSSIVNLSPAHKAAYIAVDEAQILYKGIANYSRTSYTYPRLVNYFSSENDKQKKRSLFRIFYDMRTEWVANGIIFTGTWVSMLHTKYEIQSEGIEKTLRDPYFFELKPFTSNEVKKYLQTYINCDESDKNGRLNFYANWLSGRPRHTFKIIERCVIEDKPLDTIFWDHFDHMTIDIYQDPRRSIVAKVNELKKVIDSDSINPATDVKLNKNEILPQFVESCYKHRFEGLDVDKMINSIFLKFYSVTNPVRVSENMLMLLVDYGFVYPKNDKAILKTEPFVIEAIANVFFKDVSSSLMLLAKDYGNRSAMGISFESVGMHILYNMVKKLSYLHPERENNQLHGLDPQISEEIDLLKFLQSIATTESISNNSKNIFFQKPWRAQISKYGKLVASDQEFSLDKWLDDHCNPDISIFDKPPPFFRPCNNAGPDFLMILRNNDNINETLLVLGQIKFRDKVEIGEALLRVDPQKLYHVNRGSQKGFDKGKEHIPAIYVNTFENIHNILESKRINVIRLLFMYPAKPNLEKVKEINREITRSVKDERKLSTRADVMKYYEFKGNAVSDLQVVVDGTNMKDLIADEKAIKLLSMLGAQSGS